MSDGTKIEWTDATWNVVNGCTLVSPGCANCYAMKQAHRFPVRQGLTRQSASGMTWTGEVRFNDKVLLDPLRWKRPRRIFVCAHGDLFHDSVPDEWIDRVFAVMAVAPQHTFQVLTKRAARMREYLASPGDTYPRWMRAVPDAALRLADLTALTDEYRSRMVEAQALPNVWLGVSVEDQQRADERIPVLLDTPAAVHWLSCEPLLGAVDLRYVQTRGSGVVSNALTGQRFHETSLETLPRGASIDWVVAGGESGNGARPMHPNWVRQLRNQCQATQVPFLFKQWGEFAPGEVAGDHLDPEKTAKGVRLFDGRWDEAWSEPDGHVDDEPDVYRIGKKKAGRALDGIQHDGYPA